jgi:hypothetical protein
VPAGSNAVLPAEFVEAPRDSGFGLSRHSGEAAPAETREPKASTLTETSAQGHVLPGDLKVSGYLGSFRGRFSRPRACRLARTSAGAARHRLRRRAAARWPRAAAAGCGRPQLDRT